MISLKSKVPLIIPKPCAISDKIANEGIKSIQTIFFLLILLPQISNNKDVHENNHNPSGREKIIQLGKVFLEMVLTRIYLTILSIFKLRAHLNINILVSRYPM